MNRLVSLAVLIISVNLKVGCQEGIPDRKGKFFLVPEFWLSFGTTTYIEVAPLVGYHVNDRLSVGGGPHYIYQSTKPTPAYPESWETHVFGLKGFARFSLITHAEEFLPINLFSDLFAHVEYEGMSLESKIYDPYYNPAVDGDRFLFNSWLLGAGVTQRIGMYNSASFMVLWNLNESGSSPYSNPVFRIGFNAFF
jgi:hypothetical protein